MSKKGRGGRNKASRKRGRKPASSGPPAGAEVLHCGHPERAKQHWLRLTEAQATNYGLPDAEWLGVCEPCYLLATGNVDRIRARGTGVVRERRAG